MRVTPNVLLGVLTLAVLTTPSLGQAPTVGVPNVIGQTYEQATCILQLRGLGISQNAFVPRIVNGQPVVVAQDPASPAQAQRGTAVQVRMGLSDRPPSVVAVPSIPPRTPVVRARVALQRRDLCVVITPLAARNLPNALVVNALLLPGKKPIPEAAPRGATILLIAAVQVPDVVGRPSAAAQTTLRRAGLAVGPITQTGPVGPPDSVTDQTPSAGTLVAPGSEVSLTVAGSPARTWIVPNVLGEPLDQAERDLEAAGFTSGPVTRQASPKEPGTVVDQSPSGGTQLLPPLPRVSLTVAAVEVPDVVGHPIHDAVAALNGAGLSVGTVTPAASPGPPGVVASQSVSAGSLVVPPLPSVDLTESAVAVPSVIGRGLEDAARVLREAGLNIGTVSPAATRAPPGTITGQTPAAETLVVPPLPAVDVTVSAVVMPDVVGRSLDAATHVLADAGLKVGRWVPAVSVKQRGTVIDQDPVAGTLLRPPLPVAGLTVAAVQVPNVAGQSPTAARATLAQAGLGAGMPRWSGLPLATVSGQDPPAGTLITEAGAVVALTVDVSTFRNLSAFTVLILAAGLITSWNVARGRTSIRSHLEVREEEDGPGEAGIYVDGVPVRSGSSLIADPGVQLRLIPDRGVQSLTPTNVLDIEEGDRHG